MGEKKYSWSSLSEQTFAFCDCSLNLAECFFILQCYTSSQYISEHWKLISTSSSPRQTTVGKCLLLQYPLSIKALSLMLNAHKQQQKMFGREALCRLDRGRPRLWSSIACLSSNSLWGSSRMFLVTLITVMDFFIVVLQLGCLSAICKSFIESDL